MSQIITSIVEQLQESEPVFELTSDGQGGIRSEPLSRGIQVEDSDDTLTRYVKELALRNERFDKHEGCFVIDRRRTVEDTLNHVMYQLQSFYEHAAPLKKPRQSKTYNWLCRAPKYDTEFADGLVLLYKYMITFCDLRDMSPNPGNEEHTMNGLAIIEVLRSKYER